MPEPEVTQQEFWHDLQPLLDEELSRLPDKYRVPIVLCDLEGKTRKEAAQLLGCPEGTVAGRLARARVMLAKRLAQRGVTLSGGALAVVLSEKVACAGVPTSVVSSTIKAASLFAAGQTAGVISAKVAALTEGVVKAMFVTKIKSALTVLLVVGLALAGGAGLLYQTQAAAQPKDSNKMAQAPKPAEKEPPVPATPDEKTKPKDAKTKQKVLTPEEAIKQKIGEEITVQFKVTAVITTRVSKSNRIAPEPDAGYNEHLYLKASDSFVVQLRPPAADTIKGLGLAPDKHFKGKMVQITGKLGPGPYSNLLPPGLYPDQFQIVATDLTQIEVLKE